MPYAAFSVFSVFTVPLREPGMDGLIMLVRNSGQLSPLSRHYHPVLECTSTMLLFYCLAAKFGTSCLCPAPMLFSSCSEMQANINADSSKGPKTLQI